MALVASTLTLLELKCLARRLGGVLSVRGYARGRDGGNQGWVGDAAWSARCKVDPERKRHRNNRRNNQPLFRV